MTETVYVRGAGGVIYEMDVPTGGHALERFAAALEKGELQVVPAVKKVRKPEGSTHFVAVEPRPALVVSLPTPPTPSAEAPQPPADGDAASDSPTPDTSE